MLDVMRSNARSSLIVVVFALIIASFIFSFGRGSSGFRTRPPEPWQAALNGAAVSDDEVKAFYVAQHESAAIDWVRFTGFMFRDQVKPTDDEIAAYIKDHAKEIEEAYNKGKDTRYKQPAASKVRAITVPLPPGSTPEQEQAAQKRIDAALAEVKAGKDFAEVAKAKSEDAST